MLVMLFALIREATCMDGARGTHSSIEPHATDWWSLGYISRHDRFHRQPSSASSAVRSLFDSAPALVTLMSLPA